MPTNLQYYAFYNFMPWKGKKLKFEIFILFLPE